MNELERRLSGLGGGVALETREEGQKIGGYAAVFYDGSPESEYRLFDDLIERIMPGAFRAPFNEDGDVVALFNHDSNQVLGRTVSRTLALTVDGRGLRYDIVPPDTSVGRDVVEMLKRGDVRGSSFAFRAREVKYIRGQQGQPDVRELHHVEVFDVGPVTFPAYVGTEAGLRTAPEDVLEAVRAERDAWRQAPARLSGRAASRRARLLELGA